MKYYVGVEFDVKKNKEYKTLQGAQTAADKADAKVYDEEGVQVYPLNVELVDEVPDGALDQNPDGAVNTYDKAGNKVGTATQEEVKKAEQMLEEEDVEKAEAAARTEEEVHGKIKRVFPGKLRYRRKPSFEQDAVCGATMFDEVEVSKKAVVGGRTLYKTALGYWVSGEPEHTVFIPEE